MAKNQLTGTSYKLLIYGFELNATCHVLTDEQASKINAIKQDLPEADLKYLGYGIEQQLDDFYLFQHEKWSVSRPLINDVLSFSLQSESGSDIIEFSLEEMTDPFDIDHNCKLEKHIITPKKSKENVLLFFELNKGNVCSYLLTADAVPIPENFSCVKGKIQTPHGYYEYVDKVLFKGKELEISFEEQEVRGKSTFMDLWTHG
jgi:hypothetical protein